MIEYNELEKTLEKLTIDELEQIKNSLVEFLKEKYAINKLNDYEFIKNSIREEYVDEYTDYYIKLGILRYGTYGLEELINKVILDKKRKKVFRDLEFYELQYEIVDWGRSKNINDPKSQFLKVVEEVGEIQQAKNEEELMDAIGDTLVTLIILNDILQNKACNEKWIDTSDVKEEDLHKYIQEKGGVSVTEDLRRIINTDVIIELSRLAENINKMTDDNKEYYIQKSYLHILEIVRYVFYLTKIEDVDFIESVSFIESLEFAYNTIRKRTGKTVDGVFIKEEDLGKEENDER